MSEKNPAFLSRAFLPLLLLALVGPTVQASVKSHVPAGYSNDTVTCEHPFKLTQDCSVWQGPTRPIAIAGFRMSLAAGSDGRTILLSRMRQGPDHNGYRFRPHPTSRTGKRRSRRAVECIGDVLENEGIRLERMQTVRRGQKVVGYLLEFSDNAYEFLKQFTVLESEYWLPRNTSRR
jgi:hypothetical protein